MVAALVAVLLAFLVGYAYGRAAQAVRDALALASQLEGRRRGGV